MIGIMPDLLLNSGLFSTQNILLSLWDSKDFIFYQNLCGASSCTQSNNPLLKTANLLKLSLLFLLFSWFLSLFLLL